MKLLAFAIYDSKAEAFLPPFFQATTAMAIRSFATCAQDLTHAFGQHPGDYSLFEIGSFASTPEPGIPAGSLIAQETPVNLGLAIDHQSRAVPALQIAQEN